MKRYQATFLVSFYILLGFIVPAYTSWQETQAKLIKSQNINSQLRSNYQRLEQIEYQQNLTIQQKEVEKVKLEVENKKLKEELQSKIESQSTIAVVSQGMGGSFVASYTNSYVRGFCTWYVASVKRIPNNWGNANTWDDMAIRMGYRVDYSPTIGAIAQRDPGLGHVAVVIGLNINSIKVREMNAIGWNIISEAWYPTGYFKYIHA
jgi:surface antigen